MLNPPRTSRMTPAKALMYGGKGKVSKSIWVEELGQFKTKARILSPHASPQAVRKERITKAGTVTIAYASPLQRQKQQQQQQRPSSRRLLDALAAANARAENYTKSQLSLYVKRPLKPKSPTAV